MGWHVMFMLIFKRLKYEKSSVIRSFPWVDSLKNMLEKQKLKKNENEVINEQCYILENISTMKMKTCDENPIFHQI